MTVLNYTCSISTTQCPGNTCTIPLCAQQTTSTLKTSLEGVKTPFVRLTFVAYNDPTNIAAGEVETRFTRRKGVFHEEAGVSPVFLSLLVSLPLAFSQFL